MEMEFTDDEIREELARLGYKDVPDDKLADFKKDLMKLIQSERSKNSSLNSSCSSEMKTESRSQPISRKGSEYAVGNFSNHGNQWLKINYRDAWNYLEKATTNVAHSTTEILKSARAKLPRSHSLYELPSCSEDSYDKYLKDNAESEPSKKFTKRKTSRKKSNGDIVVHESLNSSETDETPPVIEIYDKFKKLAMRDCECGKTRRTTSETQPPYRIHGLNINPSVITSRSSVHPHYRNVVRCVPFKRHQMYQQLWKAQPAIGEDNRNRIRKEVHAKMLTKEEIETYHKVYIPNPYVVPTEKPRYDLRWTVRRANSNFEMPPHGFYHEV